MLEVASKDLGEERRERILRLLSEEGRVVVAELVPRLGVSFDTVRRDLQELADAGALRRVRGGALPAAPAAAPYARRRADGAEVKAALAEVAARLLPATGVVAVGGGTTLLALAQRWPAAFRGTVVTTSPDVALALPTGVEVVLPGGRLHADSRTLTGAETVEALRGVRADLCLLGACSLHPECGVGAHHREEAQALAAMAAGAVRVAVATEAAKLGSAATFTVASPERLDVLVTDAPPPATAPWTERGVDVLRP